MLCRPGKLGSGSIISIRPNSCGPSARQHRDASNPHGHPAPWNGEPSGRNRAEPRPLPKKPSRRDRWFESCSLQRRVNSEPTNGAAAPGARVHRKGPFGRGRDARSSLRHPHFAYRGEAHWGVLFGADFQVRVSRKISIRIRGSHHRLSLAPRPLDSGPKARCAIAVLGSS